MVLVVALVIAGMAWSFPRGLWRFRVIFFFCGVALASAVWGVWDDRWQAAFGGIAAAIMLLALLVSLRFTRRRRILRALSQAVVLCLAGMGIAAIWLFPIRDLPTPGGDWLIGVRMFELSDLSRPGILGASPREPRRLLVRVWYPATPEKGADPAPYFTEAETATTARGLGQLVGFGPFLGYLKHVRTNSFPDAPLVSDGAPLPTVVFSHGYMSFSGQNTVLMEELASHGYIVYSVQHSRDASDTVMPDGDIIPMDPSLAERRSGDARPAGMTAILTGATLDGSCRGISTIRTG
ncbi:MAG: hypothetical protein Q4G24_15295 [Paracoccus sp. (in: a-proteobacteria)]|uniref:alpha/beta hydrolase n=1 Tax=Paracoccus sp. TaxID=267 RepID=UPI0026E0B52A|nr:hypothetical protein [Paracoccus sp. (in: a-proteobacteria)]MDO5622815.1 hypothetical protein [Paracoccus sp. (in: a-proteobacteria)]